MGTNTKGAGNQKPRHADEKTSGRRSFLILVGSIRAESHSAKIAAVLKKMIAAAGHDVTIFDPHKSGLFIPHDPSVAGDKIQSYGDQLKKRVLNASAVIFITPEYDGSYSAVAKLLIEHLGYPSALHHRPVAVIGVATGRIGADRAVDHLRAVLLHIGALLCPIHLSLAEVHKDFSSGQKKGLGCSEDLAKRLDHFSKEFLALPLRPLAI